MYTCMTMYVLPSSWLTLDTETQARRESVKIGGNWWQDQ